MDLYRQARLFTRTLQGRGRVARYTDLAAAGVSRSAALWRADHGRVVRVFRGTYVLGPAAPDLLDRVRAALAVGPQCVVGFHTAATLQGFGVLSDPDVHLVVAQGSSYPSHRGIRVHQSAIPLEPVLWNGILCTPPARTAVDLVKVTPDRPTALAVLDAALAARACNLSSLHAEVARHGATKGFRRAVALVGLADGRSECRQETHLRLILHDAGLREFEPQVEVYDDEGELMYRLDLADRRRGVAAEYDGASHLGRENHRNDRERHNWLDGRGWRMRYFTDRDLYRYPDRIVRTLRAAQASR